MMAMTPLSNEIFSSLAFRRLFRSFNPGRLKARLETLEDGER
jgi:hypothetical protein